MCLPEKRRRSNPTPKISLPSHKSRKSEKDHRNCCNLFPTTPKRRRSKPRPTLSDMKKRVSQQSYVSDVQVEAIKNFWGGKEFDTSTQDAYRTQIKDKASSLARISFHNSEQLETIPDGDSQERIEKDSKLDLSRSSVSSDSDN